MTKHSFCEVQKIPYNVIFKRMSNIRVVSEIYNLHNHFLQINVQSMADKLFLLTFK